MENATPPDFALPSKEIWTPVLDSPGAGTDGEVRLHTSEVREGDLYAWPFLTATDEDNANADDEIDSNKNANYVAATNVEEEFFLL